MLKIETVRSYEEFLALEDVWKRLVDEVPNLTYFLTWEFTSARWKYFSSDRELYVLTARNEEGKLVGIAPWAIGSGSIGTMRVRRLEFLCRTEIPFRFEQYILDGEALDIIAHPDYRDDVSQRFLDHLDHNRDQWDVVDLAWLSEDSPLRHHLAASTTLVVERKAPALWTRLPADWSTFEKEILGKKRAKQLRYQARLLERHYPGRVTYRSIERADEVGETVEELDKMKQRQFAAKGRTAHDDDDPVATQHREFKRELAEAAFDRGWWRFYELSVDGKMIAGTCGIVLHNNYYGLQTAFEPEWKRFGPGNLVQVFEVKEVIDERVDGFDPGHGMNESKRMWTDQEREDIRVIANHGWRGMPYFARETVLHSVREHGRTLAQRILPESTYEWIKESVRDRARQISSADQSAKQVPDGGSERS